MRLDGNLSDPDIGALMADVCAGSTGSMQEGGEIYKDYIQDLHRGG